MPSLLHRTRPATPADSGDGKVSKNAWTEEHDLTGTANTVPYFAANGTLSEVPSAFAYANGMVSVSTLKVTGVVDAASANVLSQTLTDGVTVNWNMASGQIATLTLTGTGRTMAAPTNLKVGTYILHVVQDATGNRTITTWNSVFKWTGGVAPTLSTAANSRDVFSFVCDGTNLYGSFIPDVR